MYLNTSFCFHILSTLLENLYVSKLRRPNTLHYAASDLDLHCVHMSNWDTNAYWPVGYDVHSCICLRYK